MSLIDAIKNFIVPITGFVQNSEKTVNIKEKSLSAKKEVTAKTDENNLTDTSKLEENNEKKNNSVWETIGRVILGLLTLGVSELFMPHEAEKPKEDKSYQVNGEIDKDVQQGQLGDCALISTMYSLSQSEKGAKLLKDSIKTNYDNDEVVSYTINFKGIDEKVTITKEELDKANDDNSDKFYKENGYSYSKGDDDMLLLELGWEKLNEQAYDKIKNIDVHHYNLHTQNEKGPSSLNSVQFERLIKAFADADYKDTNSYLNGYTRNYRTGQTDELIKKLDKMCETGKSFQFSDLDLYGSTTYTNKDGEDFFLGEDDTYKIIKNEDTGSYIVKNLTKGNEREFSGQDFASHIKVPDDKMAEFRKLILSNLLKESPDFMTLSVNEKYKDLVTNHEYAIKEITDDKITIVNPWDTEERVYTYTLDELSQISFSIDYGFIKD